MIYAEPGGSVTVTWVLADSGLTTVGYRIVNAETGAVVVARSTDVEETPADSGVYSATFNGPMAEDVYLAVADVDEEGPFVPVDFTITDTVPTTEPVPADLMERIGLRVETDVDEEELSRMAFEAQQTLLHRYGPVHVPVIEQFDGGSRSLLLARPADEGETLIVRDEDGDNFSADDYHVIHNGRTIRRAGTSRWPSYVEVIYTPEDDAPQRDEVIIKMVQLDLEYDGGLAQQTVGDVAKQYRVYNDERERLIQSVMPRAMGLF